MRAMGILTILAAFLVAGCAAAPKAPEAAAEPAAKARFTGSRIPQAVDENARYPATASPLFVMTRKDIDRTGEVETGEVLRRLPLFR